MVVSGDAAELKENITSWLLKHAYPVTVIELSSVSSFSSSSFFSSSSLPIYKTTFLKSFLIIWPRQVSRSIIPLIAGRNKKDMKGPLLNALQTPQCTKLDS